MSDTKTTDKVTKSEAEWRKELTPMQYAVLREKATERPFTGEYEYETKPGTYVCAGCGQTLFESDAKFDSGCGWPSFTTPAVESHVDEERDITHGMVRTEVLVLEMLGPSRPCLQRRPGADRPALLHQLGGAEAEREVIRLRTRPRPRATKDWSRGGLCWAGTSPPPCASTQGHFRHAHPKRLLLGLCRAILTMENLVLQPAYAAETVSLFKVITSRDEIVIGLPAEEPCRIDGGH